MVFFSKSSDERASKSLPRSFQMNFYYYTSTNMVVVTSFRQHRVVLPCTVLWLRKNASKTSLLTSISGHGRFAHLGNEVSQWMSCHYSAVLHMEWLEPLQHQDRSSAQCPSLTPAKQQQHCSPFIWWRPRFQAGSKLAGWACQRPLRCETLPLCQC